MNMGQGFERLIYFLMSFLMILHLVACIWLIIGMYEYGDDDGTSWIDSEIYDGD